MHNCTYIKIGVRRHLVNTGRNDGSDSYMLLFGFLKVTLRLAKLTVLGNCYQCV